MSAFLHVPLEGTSRTLCVEWSDRKTVGDIKTWLQSSFDLELESYFVLHRGVISLDNDVVELDGVYSLCPRVLGGKGGFGSMLRAIGAQIEKTTNREACRDLSGRRMRDVNNEKKLKDWIAKKADRERERERIRRERLARRLAEPKHNFDDPNYEQQKSQVADNLEDALQTGIKKTMAVTTAASSTMTTESLGKRPAGKEPGPGPSKSKASRRSLEWIGIEGGSDIDSDISDSESDDSSNSKPSVSGEENIVELSEGGKNSRDSGDVGTESDAKTKDVNRSEKQRDNPVEGEKVPSQSSLLSMLPPPGSGDEKKKPQSINTDPSNVCLESYNSPQELEHLGLDLLKSVLIFRGLKCGGTLQERAERLFSIKGLSRDEIDPSLFAKSHNGKGVKNRK